MPTYAQDARDVIAAYVGQLTQGCGDPSCEEVMCASGRRNISGRSQRDYTTRSARTIAISLASGPKPRAHLCRKYWNQRGGLGTTRSESSRDPSAWSQNLSDTAVIREACDGNAVKSRDEHDRRGRLYSAEQEIQMTKYRAVLDDISPTGGTILTGKRVIQDKLSFPRS